MSKAFLQRILLLLSICGRYHTAHGFGVDGGIYAQSRLSSLKHFAALKNPLSSTLRAPPLKYQKQMDDQLGYDLRISSSREVA